MQPNTSVIVPHPSEAGSIPAIVAQVNAHINGAFAGNALGQSSSFTSLQSAAAQGSHPALNTTLGKFAEKTLMSGAASHDSSASQASASGRSTPLGLGLGGLQPKRRSKSTKPVAKDSISCDAPSVNQTQESISRGQEILRSIVSRGSDVNRVNVNSPSASLPTVLSQFVDGMSLGAQGSQEQVDAGGMISHVLQSPVFNNLLANVAEQTGLGSPADLRSMMEQCTQSPAMRSALNNIVQQVEGEGQDLGSMLLGSGSSEGGIDFSRMIQQMMPMVSQALGRVSSRSPPVTVMGSDEHQPQSNNVIHHVERMQDQNVQIDLREARERIEQCDSSGNIFRAMLEGADNLYGEEISYEDLQELGDDAELGNVCILFLD
ncbi:hypothetical protein BHM03_00014474 [Ensete ventricosum]|uniref:Uncharacterized protein n=1 Tax=Ensete ventricosum TaxID=4639 RepID=A0A445ME38_ENSVE|nr:hypothetical protein BHM03_00014474 [Ensete ventricosum]